MGHICMFNVYVDHCHFAQVAGGAAVHAGVRRYAVRRVQLQAPGQANHHGRLLRTQTALQ